MGFEKSFHVGWGHLDSNAHMANVAFLDVAVDVRFLYFASRGFPPAEWVRLRLGPVVKRDEVDYHRELRMLQPFTVNILLAGLSADASRFRIRNEFRREDGELAARLTSTGGVLDLVARKLIAPPEALAEAFRALDRSDDFETLDSSVKR
ncbi:MAG: thioesterase family protein [Burkholderiales bacterium]|nr:thioesterase family protein [Burkholderiales bacterium]